MRTEIPFSAIPSKWSKNAEAASWQVKFPYDFLKSLLYSIFYFSTNKGTSVSILFIISWSSTSMGYLWEDLHQFEFLVSLESFLFSVLSSFQEASLNDAYFAVMLLFYMSKKCRVAEIGFTTRASKGSLIFIFLWIGILWVLIHKYKMIKSWLRNLCYDTKNLK